jgi:hypothetical protein
MDIWSFVLILNFGLVITAAVVWCGVVVLVPTGTVMANREAVYAFKGERPASRLVGGVVRS